ncbi:hypothetical protein, partial [Brevundimonas sp.]|uniref:hypothetical protein n=1 Tax=Brevundimonas sp. TaxID=1871086 RepID=UPI0028AF81C5
AQPSRDHRHQLLRPSETRFGAKIRAGNRCVMTLQDQRAVPVLERDTGRFCCVLEGCLQSAPLDDKPVFGRGFSIDYEYVARDIGGK